MKRTTHTPMLQKTVFAAHGHAFYGLHCSMHCVCAASRTVAGRDGAGEEKERSTYTNTYISVALVFCCCPWAHFYGFYGVCTVSVQLPAP